MSVQTVLRGSPLLAGVPDSVLSRAEKMLEVVEMAAEERIFDEGDLPDYIYVILDGTVRISKRGRGGQQETLSYLGEGDFFGEMALYDPDPRSARATASGPVRLARADSDTFEHIIALAPVRISHNLTSEIIRRLRDTDAHFISEIMEAERLSLVGSMASGIIHDFKNPMSVIVNAADMVDEFTDDDRLRRAASLIRRSVDRMLIMTQELLEFSRGTPKLERRSVPIRYVLAELEEQMLDRLPSAGIRVERKVEFDGELEVDPERFVRTLLNVLKNSVESMPDGGMIELAIDQREGHVYFRIADTGCGIPPDVLPSIFEPFVTHGKSGGTGLGMAIARAVVEAHGGTVTVDSEPGQGTCFDIRIPQAEAGAT